jgi:hypothetical protein
LRPHHDRLNHDDLDGFAGAVDERMTYRMSLGLVSSSLEELIGVVRKMRQDGWAAHNILEVISAEEFVAMTYRNDWRNAPSSHGIVGFRVNDKGKATEMYAFTPAAPS